MKILTAFIASLIFASTAFTQVKESLESVVKNGISAGVIKREGYKIIYLASPSQDTILIRKYYEDLIKKSGKPYEFNFQNNSKLKLPRKDINTGVSIVPGSRQNESVIPATTTGTPSVPGSGALAGQWTRQKVFGELHFTEESKQFRFEVPSGVTNIRIEAWSGGGNGFTKMTYRERVSHEVRQEILSAVKGGGGGGGAYASAIIPVQKGDEILIIIPPGGGGKSVQVKLNGNQNMFYLNNGGDGKDEGLFGKGGGGNSGGSYGIFKNSLYWIGGQAGEKSIVTNYAYVEGRSGDGMLLPAGLSVESYFIHFGEGGSAALLDNGGRAAKYINNGILHQSDATNGSFPGGGGGGGSLPTTIISAGKGAPGMVVIHY